MNCSLDISEKRSDAKYCSDRCRMRYRRKQAKHELIEELFNIFGRLPNHAAQCTSDDVILTEGGANSRNFKILRYEDLQNLSVARLKSLKKKKNSLALADSLIKMFKK